MTTESDAWESVESGSRIPGRPGAHRFWMHHAIGLARLCPPSATAFSVGAVIVGPDGVELAHGYSRETEAKVHAEESALNKLGADPRLVQATIYSTLEPCSQRKSRPVTCAQLILATPIPRVVIAWREPSLFVEGQGYEILRAAGREVVELADLAEDARVVNAGLLDTEH